MYSYLLRFILQFVSRRLQISIQSQTLCLRFIINDLVTSVSQEDWLWELGNTA
jgi:hypothetical protein